MPLRRPLPFFVALAIAFAWGYFGDSLRQPFSPSQTRDAKNEAGPTPIDSSSKVNSVVESGTGSPVAGRPGLPTAAMTAPPAPYAPGPPPRPPGAEAPARVPGAPTNTLANTLESIQPGKAQDSQIEQRNAYFDRLSQQLKELNTTGSPPPIAPLPGGQSAPENPYAAPPTGAPIQIQPEPLPPAEAVDEEPDNVEDSIDDEEVDESDGAADVDEEEL